MSTSTRAAELLPAKELKWLQRIASASKGGGMYPGEREDFIPPKVRNALERKGLIERFIPHNPVHKERFVTTFGGEYLLKSTPTRDQI